MWISNFRSAMLTALITVFIIGCHSQTYSDLEALGVSCPSRDKCEGYRNHLTYIDRSCECDRDCTAYRDCCIDALPGRRTQSSRPKARSDVKCLHYGEDKHTGVFVINKCSSDWNGDSMVREKCQRGDDFTDPLVAAPVTDAPYKRTYRNLACAECNNADMASLTTFQLKLACEGLVDLTEDQILSELTYSHQLHSWGVNRLNRFGNGTEFFGCDIIFDVPEYLNDSVRFCRSNLISKCAQSWTRPSVARLCAQYMTSVFSNTAGYRNPHCTICNNKTVNKISCETGLIGRKKLPPSFVLLLDINPNSGDRVGVKPKATPQCASGQIYDPFAQKCRQLVCGLPGHVVVNGKCVKSR